jgi:hypothetical protein
VKVLWGRRGDKWGKVKNYIYPLFEELMKRVINSYSKK